jgi:hypothetical protein
VSIEVAWIKDFQRYSGHSAYSQVMGRHHKAQDFADTTDIDQKNQWK